MENRFSLFGRPVQGLLCPPARELSTALNEIIALGLTLRPQGGTVYIVYHPAQAESVLLLYRLLGVALRGNGENVNIVDQPLQRTIPDIATTWYLLPWYHRLELPKEAPLGNIYTVSCFPEAMPMIRSENTRIFQFDQPDELLGLTEAVGQWHEEFSNLSDLGKNLFEAVVAADELNVPLPWGLAARVLGVCEDDIEGIMEDAELLLSIMEQQDPPIALLVSMSRAIAGAYVQKYITKDKLQLLWDHIFSCADPDMIAEYLFVRKALAAMADAGRSEMFARGLSYLEKQKEWKEVTVFQDKTSPVR